MGERWRVAVEFVALAVLTVAAGVGVRVAGDRIAPTPTVQPPPVTKHP